MFSPGTPPRVRVQGQHAQPSSVERRSQSANHSVRAGFTLLELLIVVGIIGVLLALIAPAFTSIKGGTDVTSAAYTIKGVLDTARTYAVANNTYTWVGFYEENGDNATSPNSDRPAQGRVIMSIVASKDGTMLYTTPPPSMTPLPSASLIQVGKLTKIDNLHLAVLPSPTPSPSPPGDTLDTRPTVASTASHIGDTAPPRPSLQFAYPLGGSQYAFQKIIQFNPRGEGVIDNSNYTMAPVSEIGVQPTHGTTVDTTNPVAIQFTGFGGNLKIYRK